VATGVAQAMKEQFKDAIDVQIHLNDSEAAQGYELRGSTTVLVNEQRVPLDVALSKSNMADYLAELMK
jgi:hypothetical protein